MHQTGLLRLGKPPSLTWPTRCSSNSFTSGLMTHSMKTNIGSISTCFPGDPGPGPQAPVLHSSMLPSHLPSVKLYNPADVQQSAPTEGRFCFSSRQRGLLSSPWFILCNYTIDDSWPVIAVNYLTTYRHSHDVCWEYLILIKNIFKPIFQSCGNKYFRNCCVVGERNQKQDLKVEPGSVYVGPMHWQKTSCEMRPKCVPFHYLCTCVTNKQTWGLFPELLLVSCQLAVKLRKDFFFFLNSEC